MIKLRPFQRKFIKAVENPAYDVCCISGPRALGKTFLAGHVLARAMTPGDPLHQPGKEYILGAASLEQARLTFSFIREALEPTGQYRWIDSTTRLGATHVATNTKLRAISSNAKTSFGLVNVPIVVLDEPGALEIRGGEMLADALFSALGKPGSTLKLICAGTLSPMATGAGHWWFDLIEGGTTLTTYVMKFQGDAKSWDCWHTIRKSNPLVNVSPSFRKKLLRERDGARRDSRLKSRFLSYRLNCPSPDEISMVLPAADWERTLARPVPPREGRPLVCLDLGGGRAWSAACAIWRSGRVECLALAPGIPSLEDQEKRDRVPAGLYRKLADQGNLRVVEGRRVPEPSHLVDAVVAAWGRPETLYADFFNINRLKDAVNGTPLVFRRGRWTESIEDINALRAIAADGPLAVEASSRDLLTASLSVCRVRNEAGNIRLQKSGTNNTGRDDCAVSLVLAAGALVRALRRPRARWRYRGMG